MREYEFDISDHLRNGLRPEEANPSNGAFLVELLNSRPSQLGLMPYEAVTLPYDDEQAFFIDDHVVDWPFPQVFFCQNWQLVGTRDRMYYIDGAGKLQSLFSFSASERWDLAVVGDYMVAAKDGSKVVVRNPVTGAWNPTTSMPLCKTVIDLGGQLFIGNLTSWGSWTDLDGSYVAWSDIGSAAFTLDRRNEAGFRRHDFTGDVVQVKRLGKYAVVYGYNGISAFQPVIEPAPTFAYKNLLPIGLYNKGALAGHDKEHCFVGSDGFIYKLDESLNIKQIGYQEYMTKLTEGLVVASFDSSLGDYYFSDGSRCFILTPNGLCEIYQRISTLERFNGVKYGVASDSSDSSFLAVTDRVDFGLRGRKSIECIEISSDGAGSFSAAVDWRNGPSESFRRTSWVTFNSQGVATIKVSATEFRFALKCSSHTDVFVSGAKVRFKMEDMKSIRGIYAPPPRGQSAS